MPPLPSYGYGREHIGPRYGSLIHGQNLRDVVITGQIGHHLFIEVLFFLLKIALESWCKDNEKV